MSDWNHNGEHDSFDDFMDYEMKYGKNGGSSGGGGGGSCLAMSLYLVGGFVLFALFFSELLFGFRAKIFLPPNIPMIVSFFNLTASVHAIIIISDALVGTFSLIKMVILIMIILALL